MVSMGNSDTFAPTAAIAPAIAVTESGAITSLVPGGAVEGGYRNGMKKIRLSVHQLS